MSGKKGVTASLALSKDNKISLKAPLKLASENIIVYLTCKKVYQYYRKAKAKK